MRNFEFEQEIFALGFTAISHIRYKKDFYLIEFSAFFDHSNLLLREPCFLSQETSNNTYTQLKVGTYEEILTEIKRLLDYNLDYNYSSISTFTGPLRCDIPSYISFTPEANFERLFTELDDSSLNRVAYALETEFKKRRIIEYPKGFELYL
jgi:hypothetical protein